MARDRKKVMQFLAEGHYVANVVDGKVTFYGDDRSKDKSGSQQTVTPMSLHKIRRPRPQKQSYNY